MELLKILTDDAPELRKVSDEILFNDVAQNEYVSKLSKNMFYTMKMSNGIGLAAPQVGVNLRIITMDTTGVGGKIMMIMFNPKITEKTGNCEMEEGCLSFPNKTVKTSRFENVTVSYRGFNGEKMERKMTGIDAICVQHEIDHLNGITFFERAIK